MFILVCPCSPSAPDPTGWCGVLLGCLCSHGECVPLRKAARAGPSDDGWLCEPDHNDMTQAYFDATYAGDGARLVTGPTSPRTNELTQPPLGLSSYAAPRARGSMRCSCSWFVLLLVLSCSWLHLDLAVPHPAINPPAFVSAV